MIDSAHGVSRLLAHVVRFDGAYLRCAGTCTIQHFHNDRLVEAYTDPAVWELMHFVHARQ
ncbi:hypothetical protein [Streptomyces sp. NPDC003393]